MRTKVSYTMDADLLATVRQLADADHRTFSTTIDLLLQEALQARGIPIIQVDKPKKGKAK